MSRPGIHEYVFEGSDDEFIMAVEPQPYSDMFITLATAAWVLGLGNVPAVLDFTSYGLGRFMVYLHEPISVGYIQRVAGPKWRDGALIYPSAADEPLRPGEQYTSHHAILITIQNPDVPRTPVEWSEIKRRNFADWARDTRVAPLPTVERGIGKVCLLGYRADSLIAPMTGITTSLSMRSTIQNICNLEPESFLIRPPRVTLRDLVIRGEPVYGVLGVKPWVVKHKMGVFLDARHLGYPIGFAWMEEPMHIDDFLQYFDARRPRGWDLRVHNALHYDPETEIITCGDGNVVVIHVDPFRSIHPSPSEDGDLPSAPSDAPSSGGSDPAPDDDRARSRTPRRDNRPGSIPQEASFEGDRPTEDCWDDDCHWTLRGLGQGWVQLPLLPSENSQLAHSSEPDSLIITLLEEAKANGSCIDGLCQRSLQAMQQAPRAPVSLWNCLGPATYNLEVQSLQLQDGFQGLCQLCQQWSFCPLHDVCHLALHDSTKAALAVTHGTTIVDGMPLTVRIYTDGSASKHSAAWAAALVLQQGDNFVFGGVFGAAVAACSIYCLEKGSALDAMEAEQFGII